MSFKITSENNQGFIKVTPRGQVTEAALIELGKTIRKLCDKANVKAAIVDCIAMSGAISAVSMYNTTPKFLKEIGISTKIAYINRPKEWDEADDKFSRDIATAQGGSLQLFKTESEAVNWLIN